MITRVQGPQFLKGQSIGFYQKLNIMKLSLSLPCEIFCFKPVFGACLYAVSHSGSLHTCKQTQKRVHLDLIVAFCVSSHVCNDLEWETAYEQAPKTGFNRIFHKEEKERERSYI